ncbi:hypothetical protein AVEN_3159-1 [Araneus ventricosus]|uniref:Uncharacterized protein n=1 Tax=Araneus ventricosus TaxID=182803 RepID=A0A4Y2QHC7_ARAVE|nr:hypothetical protein AVEN_3159-1 [Araneus ventricosus]
MSPESVPHAPHFHAPPKRGSLTLCVRFNEQRANMHCGYLKVSGFEHGTFRTESRDLITKPPQIYINMIYEEKNTKNFNNLLTERVMRDPRDELRKGNEVVMIWWYNYCITVKSTILPKSLDIFVDHRHHINEDRKVEVSHENLAKSKNRRSRVSSICERSMRRPDSSETREGDAENRKQVQEKTL